MIKSFFIFQQLNEILNDNQAHCIREITQIIKDKAEENNLEISSPNINYVINKLIKTNPNYHKHGKCIIKRAEL